MKKVLIITAVAMAVVGIIAVDAASCQELVLDPNIDPGIFLRQDTEYLPHIVYRIYEESPEPEPEPDFVYDPVNKVLVINSGEIMVVYNTAK